MRDGTAQESDFRHSRHLQVGEVLALAVEKPRILIAERRGSDALPAYRPRILRDDLLNSFTRPLQSYIVYDHDRIGCVNPISARGD